MLWFKQILRGAPILQSCQADLAGLNMFCIQLCAIQVRRFAVLSVAIAPI
jgi:hypothetical protein